ncbi:MAG: RagB/SusD family nutrient uptake outer membrane protein [Sediminibacterium sp.]|nr:RagB/SusD family nutrient uptake outer membrane protein [Chitinophagaceae bacterium]
MIKVLSVSVTVFVFTGCSKQLDIKPTDQIDGETLFTSVKKLDQAVLGVYANWNEEYILQIGSVPADECRIGLKNTGVDGSAQNLFRWSFSAGDKEILNPWSNAYQAIAYANRILQVIDNVPVGKTTEVTQKNVLKGELLALRAFQHFELYRVYAYSPQYNPNAFAIPYVTGTSVNDKPSRPSTADFFKALQQDIASAELLIAESKDNTRMGLNALYALEARVAVYTKNWALAIANASKVIAAIPLANSNEFPLIWADQSDAEVVFKLKRTNQSVIKPGDIWKNASMGIVYFAPAKKLLQSYDTSNDVRFRSYFDIDTSLQTQGQLPDIIKKYKGTVGAQNLADVKVFRTAEMYLIRAEANARLGNLKDATDDLNNLRRKRIQGYADEVFTDSDKLLTALFTERFKELPYEGHRYYDLRRAGYNIVRSVNDLPTGVTDYILTPGNNTYYIPIPQAESLANSNMKPNNPGW